MNDQERDLAAYVRRYYPQVFRTFLSDIAYAVFRGVSRLLYFRMSIVGKEQIPRGPYLIIATHEGGESGRIAAAFAAPIHFIAGKASNFSSRWKRAIFPLLKILPIRETLSNLDARERRQALDALYRSEKSGYRQALEWTESPALCGGTDIRRVVACLLCDEPVVIYPQGLFARGITGRRGSGGYALIAREYARVTGKPLPILPVEVTKDSVRIRPPFTLPQYPHGSPEGKSAYYGRIAMKHISGRA